MSERKEEDLKEEVNSSDKQGEIVEDAKISVSNIDDLINLLAKFDCKVSKYDGNFNAFKIDFPSDKDGTNLLFHIADSEDAESYLSLTEDLEKAKKTLDEKIYRLAAEFENYKKRSISDRDQSVSYAKENLFKDLLFFFDNFERGMQLYKDSSEKTDFYKGMKAVLKEFEKFIEKNKFTKIEVKLGDSFDPQEHQAIDKKNSDQYDENKILEIVQNGYKLEDKLVRPVMVIVSSGENKWVPKIIIQC